MGAQPKRKVSKARTAKRRSHTAINPAALVECPQCHNPKQSHHVCPVCGTYNGRAVTEGEKTKS
ncbi:50S ribosomal protein L32 [Chloroflexota bacterium]